MGYRKLHEFCNPSPNDDNSYKIPFEIINFYQLEIRASPFRLKPISYTSNERCGKRYIVSTKNNYSVDTSNMVLSNFLLKMKKLVEDSYLNKWRLRMKRLVTDFLNTDKICCKIYNMLLYTSLTREMSCYSTLYLDENFLHQLKMNARRISSEKIYPSLPVFYSIFDFNFLIVPIHASNHWLTGIVYQQKNCLKHKFVVSSMETEAKD
uniref:ULP_PROTEASE domain-containing protein n=1 Tax=Strongyloides venezuelensis TaxID=75913 RepID=A0A0K0F5K6_STRVS